MTAHLGPEDRAGHRAGQPHDRGASHPQGTSRQPEYVVEAWVSEQLRDRIQRSRTSRAEPPQAAKTHITQRERGRRRQIWRPSHERRSGAQAGHVSSRVLARLQQQLSDCVFCAGDAFARGNGWEITKTTGRFGFGARSYRDPRFGPGAATAHRGPECTRKGVR
jgi:hypothetical protein